jgi:hypothetical protein
VKFVIRRIVFGVLALAFDTLAALTVMRLIWEPPGCIVISSLDWFMMIASSALLGLMFTWRFAVWQKRAISN